MSYPVNEMRIFKHAALIFPCLIAFSCFAQKEIATIDFPYRSMQHFEFSKNQNGDYCLFVNKKEFYYFCYFSKEGKKIYDTTIRDYSSMKPAFLGVKPLANKFVYYFLPAYSKKNLRVITISRDKKKNADQSNYIFFSSKKEKLIKGISFGSEFYIVTANKKSSAIYVSRFNKNKSFDKNEYKITSKELDKKLYLSSNSLINDLLSTEFTEAGFKHLNLIQSNIDQEKIIVDGQNLHFNLKKGEIISLMWDTKSFLYNYLDDDLPNNIKDYNSFVIDGKLYRIILSKDELFLKVYELNIGHLIKQFHYTPDDEFNLPFNPIKKHLETVEGYKLVDEIVKTKKVLRKLSRGYASIYGFKNNNNKLHLFIGSYIPDNGTFVPIPLPAVYPMVIMLPVPTGGSSSGNYISFETVLSLPNYDIVHSEDKINNSYVYKLNNWSKSLNLEQASAKVKFSESDTHLYVLQLFKDKKQLVITEFEKYN